MGSKSKNLNFNIFNEDDYVDFDQINHNFNLLDGMGLCVESGSIDSTAGGVSVTWRYKKFLNSSSTPKYTIDASCTVLSDDSWSCKDDITKGRQSCWVSRAITVPLPSVISMVNIYDLQGSIRLSTATTDPNINWIGFEKLDTDGAIKFRAISPVNEASGIAKVACLNVKAIST